MTEPFKIDGSGVGLGVAAYPGMSIYESTEDRIRRKIKDIERMLLEKNNAYGDSALSPIRIFSSCNTIEQLRVRIDDKLSRVLRGKNETENVLEDLVGYLILLMVAQDGTTNESKG